jgi:hypothetical protein
MALKIAVEDRVSTYPGRVLLTPVLGMDNVYDMSRADEPIIEGTPINKKLFDSKADTVPFDTVVYVSTSGNNTSGTGSSDAPYATIQAAINSIPKNLSGCTVTINVASGTYNERVSVVGFTGGTLVIGVSGRSVTVRGISINSSSTVELNISNLTKTSSFGGPILHADDGSNVLIASAMQINGNGDGVMGISATNFSSIYANTGVTVGVSNCEGAAVGAERCSLVSFDTITGSDNVVGVTAVRGGIVSYKTESMTNMWGNSADTGGLVLTGTNSNELSGATLDL